MLKAEILKVLRKLGRATLSEIVRGLPWQIHPEIVRRYLSEFASNDLVLIVSSSPTTTYELTGKGKRAVDSVINLVESLGRAKWEELVTDPYAEELVDLLLSLGVLEEKRGLISIITTGCGELPSGKAITCILCPNGHLMEVWKPMMPERISCPHCGERLKHIGRGIYVPEKAVKEDLVDWALAVISEFDRRVSEPLGLPRLNDWRPAMPHEGPFFMPARQARAFWPDGWLRRVRAINGEGSRWG
jgi:predicted transcriptional regulator